MLDTSIIRVAVVLGTRPEIIKLSSAIRCLDERDGFVCHIIHTNQHYDHELDAVFFQELGLPQPRANLDVGSHPHGRQTGIMLEGLEKVFGEIRPDVVVVQGDTNTVLAGGLAAAKMHIPVAHLEAGLRSFDRTMPEEINRVVVDHIANFLFAPTPVAAKNLTAEGISRGVFLVGNSIVDAVTAHIQVARNTRRESALPSRYILATLHRDSNTDSGERLEDLLGTLDDMARAAGMPVVFPAHPRTTHSLHRFGLDERAKSMSSRVLIRPPLGYLDFLLALDGARGVITDSGGVQEEACILGIPCITVRTSTERPETLQVGANVLAPTRNEAVKAVDWLLEVGRGNWKNPFGNGDTGQTMVDILEGELGRSCTTRGFHERL